MQNEPIGYWVRKADQALTACIDDAQNENGLTRTDWQIVNTLHEKRSASRAELVDAMRPFTDPVSLRVLVSHLIKRGLVEGTDASYRLTPEGRSLHEAALTAQIAVRRRAMTGISEGEYETATRVLQRLVANLADPVRRDRVRTDLPTDALEVSLEL